MNKNRNIVHDQKHLTLSDRTYMEQKLLQGSTFQAIAATLHKDPSTISKEVRRHARDVDGKRFSGHCSKCIQHQDCDLTGSDIPITCPRKYCLKSKCKKCYREHPPVFCSLYQEFTCKEQQKAPYVCNACSLQKTCPLKHKIYEAAFARVSTKKLWSNPGRESISPRMN